MRKCEIWPITTLNLINRSSPTLNVEQINNYVAKTYYSTTVYHFFSTFWLDVSVAQVRDFAHHMRSFGYIFVVVGCNSLQPRQIHHRNGMMSIRLALYNITGHGLATSRKARRRHSHAVFFSYWFLHWIVVAMFYSNNRLVIFVTPCYDSFVCSSVCLSHWSWACFRASWISPPTRSSRCRHR